jgi:hypothetical protein
VIESQARLVFVYQELYKDAGLSQYHPLRPNEGDIVLIVVGFIDIIRVVG